MNLLISGKLTRPPSSIYCLRDITLYASVFADLNVLITCNPHNKDYIWQRLRQYGAFDFVDDIIEYEQEPGISVSPVRPCNIHVDRLTEAGLNTVITRLSVYTVDT